MKKTGLLLIMLIIPSLLYCQTDKNKEMECFLVVEKMPEFIGGKESLWKYIYTNELYTKQAQLKSIEGAVYVSFLVESNGKVIMPRIIRGLRHDLDSISLKLVEKMPDWISGKQRGKSVRVSISLPIKFRNDGQPPIERLIPSKYWNTTGKRKFEEICKDKYGKDQSECDCWYKFIIWNYNELKVEDIDFKEIFEKQKCDTK